MLVEGVAVDPTLRLVDGYRERVEHLYRHDGGNPISFSYPQEISLFKYGNGEDGVAVNVRSNIASTIRLTTYDGVPVVEIPGEGCWEVSFLPRPPFYSSLLSDGTPAYQVAQMLGVDLVGVVPNNHCAYFTTGVECVFCEIIPNYRESRTFRMIRKPLKLEAEALRLAAQRGNGTRNIVITPGNHATLDQTAEVVGQIVRSISDVPERDRLYIYVSQMAPESFHMIDRLKQSGVDGVGFNVEAWDPTMMRLIAPGKYAYGRDRMLEALAYAVSVFGPGNVFSNLVYGIQSLDKNLTPASFDPSIERDMCLEATEGLLELSVLPIFTLYHYSGHNRVGRVSLKLQPVLDFHKDYGDLVLKSGLVPPTRSGVLFNLGSITNHIYNDFFALARAHLISLDV